MKIAILGIRGLPSTYGGYETFVGELAPRLTQRGHEVTIYCRKSLYQERPETYQGMRMKYLPSIEHKAFSTLSHSFISILNASLADFDIVFAVNAANGLFGFVPKLLRKKSVLNVDGMEWLRPKWNGLAKKYFKFSARMGTKFYNRIVTDAEEMHRLYAKQFGIESTYIAYGAYIEDSVNPEVLGQYGLQKDGYYLIASRMIPDNNADIIVDAFVKSGSGKMLAIAGGADYSGNKVEQIFLDRLKSLSNDKVKFLGHIDSYDNVKELHCNCFGYIHGHQFGGINPALLKALGYSNCIFALNTPFNSEVLDSGKYGILFDKNADDLAEKIKMLEQNENLRKQFQHDATSRIKERFTWDKIADDYEQLFTKIISNGKL